MTIFLLGCPPHEHTVQIRIGNSNQTPCKRLGNWSWYHLFANAHTINLKKIENTAVVIFSYSFHSCPQRRYQFLVKEFPLPYMVVYSTIYGVRGFTHYTNIHAHCKYTSNSYFSFNFTYWPARLFQASKF